MKYEHKKIRIINWLIAIFAVLIIGYFVQDYVSEGGGDPVAREAFSRGKKTCQEAVAQRAKEFEGAFLQRKSRSKEVAETLTGWTAKRKTVFGSEEELNAWVTQQVEEGLYSPAENQKLLAQYISLVVEDWKNEENRMARELGRPVVGKHREAAPVEVGKIQIPPGMSHELWKQIACDIAANLGGEIAGALAAELAVSGGIITVSAGSSWATCGISVVVGLLVGWVADLIMDPTADVEKQLNDQLEKNAAQMRQKFEKVMLKVLDQRAKEWS